jgi:hypothetical protein
VLEDVIEAVLSPETARAVYGVVIEGEPPGLDRAETERLRTAMTEERLKA